MKINNKHGEANRSPLQVGATILLSLIIIMLILLATHNQMDTAATKASKDKENVVCTTQTTIVTGISSMTTSTSIRKTTTSTTTTTTVTTTLMTTTEATTSQTIVVTTNPPEPVTEAPIPEPYIEPAPQPIGSYSESDAVLLAQLINKEASASWEGKIAVANCVVNRANVNGISIYDVIFQNGQFTTCWSLGYYSDTDYQAAVQVLTYGSSDTRIYFFNGNHGGLNWFYDYYYNYLFAA